MNTPEPTPDQPRIAAGQNHDGGGASYSLGGSNPGAAGIGATKALASSAPGGALEEVVQHQGALDDNDGPAPSVGPSRPLGRKRPYGRGQRRAYRIRFSDREFELIRRAAEWTSLRPMGFAATAAVTAAQDEESARAGVVDQRGLVRELMRATAQLGWIGNNLNQIARTLNSGGELPDEIRSRLAQVTTAAARVEQAAEHLAGR